MATGYFLRFIIDFIKPKRQRGINIKSIKVTSCQNPDVAIDRKKKYKRKRRFTIKRIIKFFRKKLKL